MTTKELVVALDTPEMAALPPAKSEQIRNVFVPMANMLQAFEGDYDAIIKAAQEEVTPDLSARARRLRLDIAKVRVEAEHARKTIKEEYLLAGKAIDGTNNILKWAISQKEEALESIEKHAERAEEQRVAALQAAREREIAPYIADASALELGRMPEDVWQAYIGTKQQQQRDRVAAEEKAAADRVEKAERDRLEQEAIRAERDRLAQEAKEKEAERGAERAAAEAERVRLAELGAAERQQREKLEAERDRVAKEEAAERKRAAAAEAKAAKAPVRKRLDAWVDSFALPDLPGADHKVAETIRVKFEAYCDWAKATIEKELS